MTENKKLNRPHEQVIAELNVLVQCINAKVHYPKFMKEVVKGKIEEKVTGFIEASPFAEAEIKLMRACVLSLIQQGIERGELVTYKEAEKAPKEELPTAPIPESKMEVIKEETNKAE